MFVKNSVRAHALQIPAQIIKDVRISGIIAGSGPLVMAEQLDGVIDADAIRDASNTIVTGEVAAQSVTIDGRVLGSIVADKVFITTTAHFEGQMRCRNFVVDDGAHVNAKLTKEPMTNG